VVRIESFVNDAPGPVGATVTFQQQPKFPNCKQSTYFENKIGCLWGEAAID
jgi:hypothetical protein